MGAHDPNEEPRKGQYFPTVTLVDFEGGGEMEFTTVACKTCHAIVDEEFLNEHEGGHEIAPPPESGPKAV